MFYNKKSICHPDRPSYNNHETGLCRECYDVYTTNNKLEFAEPEIEEIGNIKDYEVNYPHSKPNIFIRIVKTIQAWWNKDKSPLQRSGLSAIRDIVAKRKYPPDMTPVNQYFKDKNEN